MNKLFAALSLTSMFMGSSVLLADGFEGNKKDQANTQNWNCEYCPKTELWETKIGLHFGYLSDEIFHYSNYTGIEKNLLILSGSIRNIDVENGQYWITDFDKMGSDAQQLNSRYGIQGLFSAEVNFQTIPIRKYDQLSSAFINPGSNVLRLHDDWSRSNNSVDFLNSSHFTNFSLATDWDQLGLKFTYTPENNFDYSFDYNRIVKSGIRESSANQYFQSVYVPIPVDSVIEDFSARVDYVYEQWFASFAVKFSRFDNNYDFVAFANPYASIISGADATILAEDPDNRALNVSLNVRYAYMTRSFIKAHYSYGQMLQDEAFLPYTTNQTLLNTLPSLSLDGEVITQNLSLKVNHWYNRNWSLRAKYNYRDRFNKTNLKVYRPVISDIFSAESIINIPYDLTKVKSSINIDWRFMKRQLLSLGVKNQKMERVFQTMRKTSEDAMFAKYRAHFNNEFQLNIAGERSNRSGSAPELVDLIRVNENPLLQRFNVSDRDHYNLNMQFTYTPMELPLAATISAHYSEDDYQETELGLQYSWQNNINFDLNWQITEDSTIGLFYQREVRETNLGGSEDFSGRDWLVDNDDDIDSYGLSFSVKNLWNERLNISGTSQLSVADTQIAINNAGYQSTLPPVESYWTVVEIKADYQYSERLSFAFSLVYQDFESHDFAIDEVIPGAAANLLTFSAMSNNYNLSYLQLSAYYHF